MGLVHIGGNFTRKDSKEYTLVTGCLIPSRFPYIEKSSRMVLENLGVHLQDVPGMSCCPNQMAVQASDKETWRMVAARNLCLAEKAGCDIVSLCNGCYDTLKTVNSELKEDAVLRKKVNEALAESGLEFKGIIDVKHVVQVLHDDVGLGALEKSTKYPLGKLRIAPFEGCHVKRPMDHMGFDSPKEPVYLSEILKTIGGDVIWYPEHYSCCGGGLSIGRAHDVVPASRRILRSVVENGGEAMVVNCPFCFSQFFKNEKEINSVYFDNMHLPIFYITELIGVAMGFDPEEMGLTIHFKEGVGNEEKVVDWIIKKKAKEPVYNKDVTAQQMEFCSKCLACSDDCATAMVTTEYHPEELVRLVLAGKDNDAIARKDIWFCMNCHECAQRCPQGFGMVKLVIRLKNLAIAQGMTPEVINHRLAGLRETGYSFEPDDEAREELELPDVSRVKAEELRQLLDKMNVKKATKVGE